jgi:hypothetical protein
MPLDAQQSRLDPNESTVGRPLCCPASAAVVVAVAAAVGFPVSRRLFHDRSPQRAEWFATDNKLAYAN